MDENKMYAIPGGLVNAIAAYLELRPYREVSQAMGALGSLPEVPAGEFPAETSGGKQWSPDELRRACAERDERERQERLADKAEPPALGAEITPPPAEVKRSRAG